MVCKYCEGTGTKKYNEDNHPYLDEITFDNYCEIREDQELVEANDKYFFVEEKCEFCKGTGFIEEKYINGLRVIEL